jgi:hypothetical protein
MRCTILSLLLACTSAWAAPLSVQIRCEKDTFLVYEAIPVTVSVHNFSGRNVAIDESEPQTSLEFVVATEAGQLMRAFGHPSLGHSVLIPPGKTVSQTVDLLPLYELRERGTYRIYAVLRSPAGTAQSPSITITLLNGRELWSQVAGLPGRDGEPDQYRTYTLLAWRSPREDGLYVQVRDDVHSTAYSLVALGAFLPTFAPQAKVDADGNLHVLFQNGPRSFGYVEIDPVARPIARAAYSDFNSRPTLTGDKDGRIRVTGGEQTYPKVEHIMTSEELNPPPPPKPKPKPKRHWWWPFGPK